jgi:hypothetical protein
MSKKNKLADPLPLCEVLAEYENAVAAVVAATAGRDRINPKVLDALKPYLADFKRAWIGEQ